MTSFTKHQAETRTKSFCATKKGVLSGGNSGRSTRSHAAIIGGLWFHTRRDVCACLLVACLAFSSFLFVLAHFCRRRRIPQVSSSGPPYVRNQDTRKRKRRSSCKATSSTTAIEVGVAHDDIPAITNSYHLGSSVIVFYCSFRHACSESTANDVHQRRQTDFASSDSDLATWDSRTPFWRGDVLVVHHNEQQ